MDIWQLKIFCKTVELKSFSKAGEAVHLTQPTISSHIKDLEAHFGCRLIDRLGKKIAPTKAGELLYSYATKLITLMNETESAMSEFQGKIRGHFVVGGSTIPGGYIIPRLIGSFSNTYPDVKISLIIGDTEEIIQKTQSGTIEIGIVGAQTNFRNITQEKLIEDNMCLIVKSDHKWASQKSVSLKSLFKEPFITREQGSGTLKSFKKSLEEAGASINRFNIVSEMGNTTAICQGIKSGVGISILSTIAVQEELNSGVLKALKVNGLNLKRQFYLTRLKNRSLSPVGAAFINYIKTQLDTND